MALTRFAIMDDEERMFYASGDTTPMDIDRRMESSSGSTGSSQGRRREEEPKNKSWKHYDSVVKNQGGCKTCTTFATTALFDNWARRKTGKSLNSSPQEL